MKKTAKPKLAMKKTVAKPAMKGPSKASNLKSYKFMPSKEYVAPKPAKKAAPTKAPVKAASKPATKVAAKPMKKVNLPGVTTTATSKPKLRPIQKQAPDTIFEDSKSYPGGRTQNYFIEGVKGMKSGVVKPGKFDPKLEVRNRVADYMNYTDTAKLINTKKLNELRKGIEDAKENMKSPNPKNPTPNYKLVRKK